MELNEQQEVLEKYLKKIGNNIYEVMVSLNILRMIEDYAEKVNEDDHGSYYNFIQRQMVATAILNLNKIFDTHRDSITINKTTSFIMSNQRQLPLQQRITSHNADDFHFFEKEELLKITNTRELSRFLIKELENIKTLYDEDLEALKDIRDTRLAHSDKKAAKSETTWGKIDELVLFILDYIDLISHILLSRAWSGDGDESCSLLKEHAKIPSYSLKRTFEQLGYI